VTSKKQDLSLRDRIAQIRKEKEATRPNQRRYSAKEIDLILEVSQGMENWELEKLTGVHPATVKRWRRRQERPAEGESADPPKVDHYDGYHPHWQKILDLWRAHPGLGPAQLKNQLKREGLRVSVSTVRAILEENGYVLPKMKEKVERVFRYEAARPRELVHMDFKHFYINKQKVFLLLMQDDYSRFLCGYKLSDSENIDAVIEVFEASIARYGRMRTIMTDAGSAFYSWNGINRFQRLIGDEYGIDHIKAKSPRSNGKVESVNKQIEKELLRVKEFSSLEEADLGVSEWIQFYNFERTHMGLGQSEVPADRFLYGWDQKSEDTKPKNEVWEELLRVAVTKIK
jgi:putative transposase